MKRNILKAIFSLFLPLLIVAAFAVLLAQDRLGLRLKYSLQLKERVSVPAGESFQADTPQAVYVSQGGSDERPAGKLFAVDCTNPNRYRFIGFVKGRPAINESIEVISSGVVSGFSDLRPGTIYFASAVNPGAIQDTPPPLPEQYKVAVGIALSPTSLKVIPELAEAASLKQEASPGVDNPTTEPEHAPAASMNISLSSVHPRAQPLIENNVYDCLEGNRRSCMMLADLRGRVGSVGHIGSALEKRCFRRIDLTDCYEAGKLGLLGSDAGKQARLKESVDACMGGDVRVCYLAAGFLVALNKGEDLRSLLKQACEKGIWETCYLLGENLSPEELRATQRRCAQKSPKDCLTLSESKPALEFGCKLGDLANCLMLGSEPLDAAEAARLPKECEARRWPACLQLGANGYYVTHDYAAAKKHLSFACQGKVEVACRFIENHVGALEDAALSAAGDPF